jgi:hypothetical protein
LAVRLLEPSYFDEIGFPEEVLAYEMEVCQTGLMILNSTGRYQSGRMLVPVACECEKHIKLAWSSSEHIRAISVRIQKTLQPTSNPQDADWTVYLWSTQV